MLKLMMITSSPDISSYIENNGVNRIFLDQEVLGKTERQGNLDTHKAAHSNEDVALVKGAVRKAEVMVRVNPMNPETIKEVDAALNAGADRLMLPMFTESSEVEKFLEIVDNRCPVTFLAETPQSIFRIKDWLPLLEPKHHVHIGLNDFTIGLGLKFLFEPLASGLLDKVAEQLNSANIEWGFGGIARIEHGELPAEMVVGEHVRLGSSWVILSRAFHKQATSVDELTQAIDFPGEIKKLRAAEQKWRDASNEELRKNHERLAQIAFRLGKN